MWHVLRCYPTNITFWYRMPSSSAPCSVAQWRRSAYLVYLIYLSFFPAGHCTIVITPCQGPTSARGRQGLSDKGPSSPALAPAYRQEITGSKPRNHHGIFYLIASISQLSLAQANYYVHCNYLDTLPLDFFPLRHLKSSGLE